MDKRFGIYTKGGWRNIAINYDDDGDEMDNI